MSRITGSFMGANSPIGFCSFFEEIYDPYKNHHPYIIKGGPGTGKSTLMKKVARKAEEKGYETELIYCSSDPKSLDGIIVKDIGISVIDGTSPHVIEPKFPGAVENIINMGDFWDKKRLAEKSDVIRSLTLENSMHHFRSARYLSAAGAINSENVRLASSFVKEDKINSFAIRFVSREMPAKRKKGIGKRMRRFISGITPEGVVFLDDSVKAQAVRVIGIKDSYSAVSPLILQRIGDLAVKNGYDVIFCQCPLKPKGDCEHIIIPEVSLALVTVRKEHNISLECDRLIHCKRFMYPEAENYSQRLRSGKKLCSHLIGESINSLKSAKETHDRLEKEYIEVMDFHALNDYTDIITEEMFDILGD